jgi:maltose alpha-D-glucosyltransferase/alpha-amylase
MSLNTSQVMEKYWYKNAIIYSLHVKTFRDANGDGIGDFRGLTHSLDYLAGLGVTCIWLLPFFPSPHKDHGYDIADYFNVDQRYGSLGHFAEFLDEAAERGIKVIIDLVFNHTSIDHPWFQEARKDKHSPYRNYYIWLDEKPANDGEDVNFGHHQDGNWAYDDVAGQYFYHTFYKHQADLNLTNPKVQEELRYVLHFWLKLGVSGFRLDAVPHMLKDKGKEKFKDDPFQLLRDIRAYVEDLNPKAILLGESDTEPKEYKEFFGGRDDQVQMLFNFYLNNYLFLALARKEAKPVAKALERLPQTTITEQMGVFIRNHDELDLERLSKAEREEVFHVFAPDENMRIYGRGIRRRLAPMLNNDRRWLELVYSLLFSLPGTPVLRYGDEIGMGEDLSLEERHSIRTVMQWSPTEHAGFSTAETISVPVIKEGPFGNKKVNVYQQLRNPTSLLSWFERVIAVRKDCIEFGYGDYEVIKSDSPAVFAHYCFWKHGVAFAVHNFSDLEHTVTLKHHREMTDDFVEYFSDQEYEKPDGDFSVLKLGPFGYRWFRKNSFYV